MRINTISSYTQGASFRKNTKNQTLSENNNFGNKTTNENMKAENNLLLDTVSFGRKEKDKKSKNRRNGITGALGSIHSSPTPKIGKILARKKPQKTMLCKTSLSPVVEGLPYQSVDKPYYTIPDTAFKRLFPEKKYGKVKIYVTNKDGEYDEDLGLKYVISLEAARAKMLPKIIKKSIFLKKVETEGSPEIGDAKAIQTGNVGKINRGIDGVRRGLVPLEPFIMEIADDDVRSKVAQVIRIELDKTIADIIENQSVDCTNDAYELSWNSKTEEYDHSDYMEKLKIAYNLRKNFGEQFGDILESSRLSNGKISLDFIKIYLLKNYYHKEYLSIKSFEKNCIKDGKVQEDALQFFIDTQEWLKEETGNTIFDKIKDQTGKIDQEKAELYKTRLNDLHRSVIERNDIKIARGEEPITPDYNEIALNALRVLED